MKPKKLVSFILVAVMAISLLPTFTLTAFADGGGNALPVGNAIGSTQITDFGTYPVGASQDSVFMKISDNELLLLYIADDNTRDGRNKPALYYSVYTNSAWNTPRILEDDRTADSHPYAYDMGDGRILVAWSSADRSYVENVNDELFLNSFNIKSAFFDKTSKTFEAPMEVTKSVFTTEFDNFTKDVPAAAVYDSDSNMVMLMYIKSKYDESYGENYLENPYTVVTYLLYDGAKGRWLNNYEDLSEEEQRQMMESYKALDYSDSTIADCLKVNCGERYLDIVPHVNADNSEFSSINDPEIYKISNNGSMFSFLMDNGDKPEHFITTIQYDFAAKNWGKRSSGLITNKSCVSTKICYDGSGGLLFAGFADKSGNGGTIECYGFYYKDGMTSENIEYKSWQPVDGNWLAKKVAAVHTDNITGFSVFEDGEDKYLVYSESDESGAELRTIKLGSSFDGENLSAECTPCELVIAKTSGANKRYEILHDYVQNGKIDLLCRLNGSEIQRISHTPSANIELAELRLETENPQPGDTVNVVAVVRNSGFKKYSGTFNVDFSATGNTSATVPHTADIESGETVEVKRSVTIPNETKNVTVSASIGSDKKEIALQYILTPKASDFTFAEPTDLTYNGSARNAMVTSDKSGMGTVRVKYYDESGVETDPINAGKYTVKIDVEAGTDYTAASDLTADGWEFIIERKNITGAGVGTFDEMTYSGDEQTPSAKVTIDGLPATGVWSKVTNVIDKTTFTANGNFEGTISDVSPNMAKKSIETATLALDGELIYNGQEQTQNVTLTLDGFANVTFDIFDNKQTNVKTEGDYTLKAEGTGNFEGTKTLDWNIKPYTPTENAATTASVRKGRTLAEADVTKGEILGLGGTALNGDFAWVDGTKTIDSDSVEQMTFTPSDKNYVPITFDVAVSTYSSSGGSSTKRYTVMFDTNGGSTVTSQTVKKNTAATEPTKPTKEGYVFEGWYTDGKFATEYDFDTRITKNLTLYAKWTEDEIQEPGDDNTDDEPQADDRKNPFADVKEDDWFFESVKYANENGLMSGMTTDTFAPNLSLTRGMLATILYRLAGEPAVNKSIPFADVKGDMYYANAIIWAQQNGIVSGISETEFVPDENITREQIAAIIYRYAKFKGIAPTGAWAIKLDYADVAEISDYAAEGVMYCTLKGIMQGKDNNMFAPKDFATRAEIAAILKRFIENSK